MSLCIYTAVSGKYINYVPMFKYCAHRAFPHADIRVDEYDNIPVPYYAACVRFLNNPGDYDNVYVTDIDMMLMKTSPTAEEFHKQKMMETGLCYSNTPRKKEQRGPERLTGLHFASRRWYEKTTIVRATWASLLSSAKAGGGRIDDELMLMDIARRSLVGIPPAMQLSPLHFGIHLGTIRAYWRKSRETMRQQLAIRISPDYARQWLEVINQPEMNELMYVASKDRVIREELITLESFCQRRAKE